MTNTAKPSTTKKISKVEDLQRDMVLVWPGRCGFSLGRVTVFEVYSQRSNGRRQTQLVLLDDAGRHHYRTIFGDRCNLELVVR